MKKFIQFQESAEVADIEESPTYTPANYTASKDMYIYPKIQAIHAGKTKNKTYFVPQRLRGDFELRSGVYSWTYPYEKPMLTHHNQLDGEPIGRVIEAEYKINTTVGREGLVVKVKISDPEAIEKVLDGRYSTVSIGGETDSATCSICGQELTEEHCGHMKGEVYEGQECYWVLGNIWFKELSFVNVPADTDARVIDVGAVSESTKESIESNIDDKENHKNNLVVKTSNLDLEDQVDIKEFYSFIKTLKEKNISEYQIAQSAINLNENEHEEGGEKKLGDDIRLENMTQEQMEEFLEKEVETLETAKKQIKALKDIKKSLENNYQELKENYDSITEEKDTINNSLVNLTKEKDELKQSYDNLEKEKGEIEEENAELYSNLHRSLAERVVDMKMYLGKPDIEDRESAIEEHIKRNAESLSDTMTDLQLDMDNNETLNALNAGDVDNKGLAEKDRKNKKDSVDDDTNKTGNESDNSQTYEKEAYDVYKSLFGGKKKKK